MLLQLTPAFITFLLTVLIAPILIFTLKKLKLTQPIRVELPADHQEKKGTPLMAGSVFFVGIIVALSYYTSPVMLFLVGTFILFSFIGFLDDFWKASKQDPGGVSGRTKLIFQFGFTILLLYTGIDLFNIDTSIRVTESFHIVLPYIPYLVIITLFIVGTANAINFTDGMDGLLGMVAIPTYFFFFVITDNTEVKVFCLVMIATILGFLIYNLYPAKAFMGDTGSLAIGGTLSFLAIIENVEILIPILFIIYLAEQLSVIIQVAYFKRTKKKLFQFTPIHYHYGIKYGWSENMIVTVFSMVSWAACGICLVYFEWFM
ncbi:phospho-N-acetylmuramoyl-pentapeptide-transferase [Fictibacillus phosphorivorans]|uniref:phospho-N-acetylmuramoyl-pentapeptide- transferase n=1 Tax=Fictibacillus phosphorivorans TaxID=1221500 RepID=UPI00203E1C69|nr:phospho-N-acetylmuramoyl-pentapeptide-transferase [Fictibacillus phosphorivorans]MCM3776615.1 phospho-N-acetylmuramoyl-pentapeptide-transferase [Fictibacillus phosphorivorans]